MNLLLTTPRTSRWGRCLLRAALVLWSQILGPSALAQDRPIEGTILVLIADRRDGRSAIEYMLLQPDGRTTRLLLNEGQRRQIVDPRRLHGVRATVRGRPAGAPTAPEAALEVSSLAVAPSPLLSPQAMAVTGAERWAVIGCRFSDVSGVPSDAGTWARMLGAAPPGLQHYWQEVSSGAYSIAGSAPTRWFDLPKPWSYYHPGGLSDAGLLARDCLGTADSELRLPDFTGLIMQFNADLMSSIGPVSFAWGGLTPFTADGVTKGYRMAFMAAWAATYQYVWAHEMGHTLGLWHSGTGPTDPYGSWWDVMSYGATDWPVAGGAWPAGVHTIGPKKAQLGWIPPNRVLDAPPGTSQTVLERLALPVGTAPLLIRIPIPGSLDQYTLEARRFTGYDRAGGPWGLAGQGVVIHRYRPTGAFPNTSSDAYVIDADGDGWVNDPSGYLEPGESWSDPVDKISVIVAAGPTPTSYSVTVTRGANSTVMVSAGGTGAGRVISAPAGIDCRYNGDGSSPNGSCTGAFLPGTTVSLMAYPDAGSALAGWTGACTGSTCVLDMSQDRAVRVEFAKRCTVNLTASPAAGGSAAVTGGEVAGSCGRSVTAAATSATGYSFLGWFEGGTRVSTANPWTFSVTTDRVMEARFQRQCTLGVIISPAGGGIVTVVAGTLTGPCDRAVTLAASPNPGFRWVGWYDGGLRADTARVFAIGFVDGSRVLEARFERECTVTLNSLPSEAGVVSFTSGEAVGACGRPVTVRASASPGHAFLGWYELGGPVSTANPWSFAVVANRTLEARFERLCTVSLAASPAQGGSAILTAGEAVGRCGRLVRVEATPGSGYDFLGWYEGSVLLSTQRVLEEARPTDWVVEARFGLASELAIRTFDELAGKGTRLAAWERIALDQSGNRNARLDLGDLLALLDRHPTVRLAAASMGRERPTPPARP